MRVTQSMLSSNMLRNLNNSYSKMGKLQEQLTSGSKINRPSDDPVAAIKGMGFRTDLNKVEQFTRNMNQVNSWIDTTDESLGQVGEALKRVQELVTQAANDTNGSDEREKILAEISQIKAQIKDVANTKVGDDYIFSGTKTQSPLYDANGNMIPATTTGTSFNSDVKIEVFDGIQLNVNTDAVQLFKDIEDTLTSIEGQLSVEPGGDEDDANELSALLGDIQAVYEDVLAERAEVGAKQNRAEMMTNRLSIQEINVKEQMSNNEDVDYAEAITEMVTQESIHQAALSVGANIIQQTLVDFIR
ncbi:flagellar hook-associated protein FlgL [Lysinibacillus telephonicus]|uniref:flagellar hook-associated protein FlgL n=1 Tax=Lysinibacillus telephonicus TaxID=1714840 RepID=UPI00397CE6A1